MRRPNQSPILVSLTIAIAVIGLACEKDVREVRRPGQPRDPYAAIRGAPMGFSGSPSTGVRGTPSAMGRGSINSGVRNAPETPTGQAKASIGYGAINPAGASRATGSAAAVSPTDRTRARATGGTATVPGGTPTSLGGAPTSLGGAAWSPTDTR